MNIVLVSVGNFQEYILDNIRQLLSLGHDPNIIHVITEPEYFARFPRDITLVNARELKDTYQFNARVSRYQDGFRNGFWRHTSARFFYMHAYMMSSGICDVIHLENDVPVYYNCDILLPLLDKSKLYMPFDSYKRNIASIVYIPNVYLLTRILDIYDIERNDMENFASIREKCPEIIDGLPICIQQDGFNAEQRHVCANFERLNMIFDAAAIGQYLGGVDPRNMSGDTTGFINETCVIKYNVYKIQWIQGDDGITRPFLIVDGNIIPVFNLHIHSKNLSRFTHQNTDCLKSS